MAPARRRSAGSRRVGVAWLASAAALGVIALAAQGLWLWFEHGARTPALRPVYVAGCAILGCELPPLRSLAAWSASAVEVRWHPRGPGLVVSATITNHAEYPQPLPTLLARFTDIDGGLVAEQPFAPPTYLRGGAVLETLPAAATLPIEVIVGDPGASAVNCELGLAWPVPEPPPGE